MYGERLAIGDNLPVKVDRGEDERRDVKMVRQLRCRGFGIGMEEGHQGEEAEAAKAAMSAWAEHEPFFNDPVAGRAKTIRALSQYIHLIYLCDVMVWGLSAVHM